MERGARVRVAMTKWGDRPHWEFDALYLGADEHGDWIGLGPGTHFARPDHAFTASNHQVGLVPEAGWVATWHGEPAKPWDDLGGSPVALYVDMTSVPVWDGARVTAVDLDLDVVQGFNGRVIVDDEDEFAEHQVTLGYPAEVVALAEESCAWVQDAVRRERAPFDGATSARWLAVLHDFLR